LEKQAQYLNQKLYEKKNKCMLSRNKRKRKSTPRFLN
jgi:hypothetical protein